MRLSCTIPGKPIPCPRPRVTRYGKPYYSKEYTTWKDAATYLIRDANARQNSGRAMNGPVECLLRFYGWHGSSDGDNLAKSVLDAAVQAGVIEDDRYVMHLDVWKMPKEGEPRTEVEIVSLTP